MRRLPQDTSDAPDTAPAPTPAPAPSYEIRTPVTTFHGVRAGVQFKDGVGHTGDVLAAMDCQRFGFTVIDLNTGQPLETRPNA